MPALGRAWIATGRVRRRLRRRVPAPREELVRRYAPGRTWVDVGCMWDVDGALAFLAEESGATRVTGVDVMEPTPAFRERHSREGSSVRFVRADLLAASTPDAVGRHDVAWCTGLLYHAPHPLLVLERLRVLARELVILGSATVPEVPGIPNACVFYPGLGDAARAVYRPAGGGTRHAITGPFDPAQGYGNWFWGLSPSAVRGMLAATGLEVVEWLEEPFHVLAVTRPAPAAAP